MSAPTRGGRRCGGVIDITPYLKTLDAADHVAAEFVEERRVEFLAQAIRREHDGVDEARSLVLAKGYVWIQS